MQISDMNDGPGGDYNALLKKYNTLYQQYQDLKIEYSENVIIQSMNDMKKKYEDMLESTVPKYKYDLLVEQKKKMFESVIGSCVIVDYLKRELKKIETESLIDRSNRLFKIQLELFMLKDILKDGISST